MIPERYHKLRMPMMVIVWAELFIFMFHIHHFTLLLDVIFWGSVVYIMGDVPATLQFFQSPDERYGNDRRVGPALFLGGLLIYVIFHWHFIGRVLKWTGLYSTYVTVVHAFLADDEQGPLTLGEAVVRVKDGIMEKLNGTSSSRQGNETVPGDQPAMYQQI